MDAPVRDPRDQTIADLVSRLTDDARAYAQAEVDLLKEIARHRAARARTGAILLVAGAVLLLSSSYHITHLASTICSLTTATRPLLSFVTPTM